VADGVDAAVEPMKPPRRHPVLDRSTSDPQPLELGMSHNTVLALSEGRDRPVTWLHLSLYIRPKSSHVPIVAAPHTRDNART
jgi:hypothetical protein